MKPTMGFIVGQASFVKNGSGNFDELCQSSEEGFINGVDPTALVQNQVFSDKGVETGLFAVEIRSRRAVAFVVSECEAEPGVAVLERYDDYVPGNGLLLYLFRGLPVKPPKTLKSDGLTRLFIATDIFGLLSQLFLCVSRHLNHTILIWY